MKTVISFMGLMLSILLATTAAAQTVTTSWSIFVSPAYNGTFFGGTCGGSLYDAINRSAFGTGSGELITQELSLDCVNLGGLPHYQAAGNIMVAASGLRFVTRAQGSTYGIYIPATDTWVGGRAVVQATASGTDWVTIGADGEYLYELRFSGSYDGRCTSDTFDGITGSVKVGDRLDSFTIDGCGAAFPASHIVRISGTAGARLEIAVTLQTAAIAQIGDFHLGGDPTPTGSFEGTVINEFGDLEGTTTVTADASHTLQFFLTPVTPGGFYTTDSGASYADPELPSSFRFTGFFSPLTNPPTLNLAKAGAAVPVKFRLAGDRGLDILQVGYPTSERMYCDTTVPLDNVESTVTAGESGLTYDGTSDTYTYVWKTQKSWAGTCRRLNLVLSDGSLHSAQFMFAK